MVDFDQPVTVFGLTVHPGDFIHADRHGAVVVPPDILPLLVESIAKMQASESLILAPAREAGFDFPRLKQAWDAFERART